MKNEDTICAISTPVGEGGIGIVRISGKDAITIADKIFFSKKNKKLSNLASHTIHYGEIRDNNSKRVDEALVSIMKAPNTYTKEDVVEINCHGGAVPLKMALERVLKNGARLAEPGEFTKRAFLNGRIDLAQAEAVMDIISSKTDDSLRLAVNQLSGILSKKVNAIREELISIIASVEASIDFVDEDIEFISRDEMGKRIKRAVDEIEALITTADEGRIYKEGIATAIIGRPNVGKSSLLNALLKEERAIVTPVPGTTRDVIEEWVNIKGMPLRILDTAGIRHTEDIVEIEGVKRSREAIKMADIILLLIDGSVKLNEEDKRLMEEIRDKKLIVLLNKSDLPSLVKKNDIEKALPEKEIVSISALTGEGVDSLKAVIHELLFKGGITAGERPIITNLRHKTALEKTKSSLENLQNSLKENMSEEFLAVDLRAALNALGEITGETATEDILNRIFEEFCVGK
ncbi:MAG: tRNA uridine-5-carboxymethylaminomethyl(34) synthesis GTPase MnmE [Nitrospirae bacterium]|nr:tRNA uridine-5-carboxymethylaminomethyl(34) synthesis GTPase MnmE [Nitrospirota bacterium]